MKDNLKLLKAIHGSYFLAVVDYALSRIDRIRWRMKGYKMSTSTTSTYHEE